jgi:hypothetical protein
VGAVMLGMNVGLVCLGDGLKRSVRDGLERRSVPAGEGYDWQFHPFNLFEYYSPMDQRTISHFLLRRSKDNRVI